MWLTTDPWAVVPSPRFQVYEVIVPPGSLEAAALSHTAVPVWADAGEAEKAAVGGEPAPAIVCETESSRPELSVTVSVTVWAPAWVKACVTVSPLALVPSPKFHV